MKKYIEFTKESIDQEEIRNIFNDFLDEFGFHDNDFKIEFGKKRNYQDNLKIDQVQVSFRIPPATLLRKDVQWFFHTYLYFGIYIHKENGDEKLIEKNVDPKHIELIEEIDSRMEEIGLKMIDILISDRLIFAFKKLD